MENDMELQHSERRYFPVMVISANAVEKQLVMEPYFMCIILNTGARVEPTVWQIWLQYAINAIHQKTINQAESYIIGNRSFQILKALLL